MGRMDLLVALIDSFPIPCVVNVLSDHPVVLTTPPLIAFTNPTILEI